MTSDLSAKLDALINLLTCPLCKGEGVVVQYGYYQGNTWFVTPHVIGQFFYVPPGAATATRMVECSCRENARKLLEKEL